MPRSDEVKRRLQVKLASRKTICLVMIVKNESKIIERLLESLRESVQMISIVDTGSTDDTKQRIGNWGRKAQIPTVVHSEPFVDFEYNRTHSVRAAQKTFPKADYLLLSDADFVWEGEIKHKNLLLDHMYLVEQYNECLCYWNTRLLDAKIDWECKGLTHEFWRPCAQQKNYQGTIRSGRINGLKIKDLEDGGAKGDKFERDERLLRKGIADPQTEPGLIARYKFYLAQTLRDQRKNVEAIQFYKSRIEDGGFAEEVYYAKFQLAVCQERIAWEEHEKNDDVKIFNEAKQSYWNAHQDRPIRAEALYALTKLHRELGENDEAFRYALMGKQIPLPTQDVLFLDEPCYAYLFDYEISIVAFYVDGKKDVGAEALEKLLDTPNLPAYINESCRSNAKHYL
jgi:glycosyltransferase involved in cell wall biosynthesis